MGDPYDFEKLVCMYMQTQGWKAHTMPPCNEGYDIYAEKNGVRAAIQVRDYKRTVSTKPIEKFIEFMESHDSEFDKGFFVSSEKGFSAQAKAYANETTSINLVLGVYDKEKNTMVWSPVNKDMSRKYIGVWTCKGGTGKTTVAAHLAGAFALSGYDALLLDLDPQKNLSKMLGKGVEIRDKKDKATGKITVVDYNDWDEMKYREKVIVCDCSPDTKANPKEMIRKFDYCIIPILLTPLGINKNGVVINETCATIRAENNHAKIFVVVNNLMTKSGTREKKLNDFLRMKIDPSIHFAGRCYNIDPFKDFAIRHSKDLLHWGYGHVIEGEVPSLAFTKDGNSYPKQDFLKLAEHIQMYTDLGGL